ncbi:MAG: EamA family transporter RarD [Acidimicrobiia bacterium]
MEQRRGIWLAVAAYVAWGIGPIFWNTLSTVPALQVLGHRILWSVPLLFAIIAGRGRLESLRRLFRAPGTVLTALAGGVLLAFNWGVFVWAVTAGHIVDASLGYFINPLVSVGLGVVVLREHLTTAQRVAVGIAAVGVAGMAILVGIVPWISLALAFSFAAYGLLKKRPNAAPPFEGLFMETVFVAAPALVYLAALAGDGQGAFGSSPTITLLLIAAGAYTVTPLVLFAAAARRIPLSLLGILQYIAPTMHLVIGVVVFGEVVSGGEWFGFVMVWIALIVFTVDNARTISRARSAAT